MANVIGAFKQGVSKAKGQPDTELQRANRPVAIPEVATKQARTENEPVVEE
jgi:hypothetical protein